jgi:hypothetical protein
MVWEYLSGVWKEALARLGLRLDGFQHMLQSSQFDGSAFGCTVESTTTRATSFFIASVRHRQALLDERRELRFAHPLPPPCQRQARWIKNPYFQFFPGEEFFQHRLPFDRSHSASSLRSYMRLRSVTAAIQAPARRQTSFKSCA